MSITSANAVFTLSIAGLYGSALPLQGFIADDLFDFGQVSNKEIILGADGIMSAGWVPSTVTQNIAFLPDSLSIAVFEAWHQAEQAIRSVYYADGNIVLDNGSVFTLTRGVLNGYSPAPDAKKILQPRKFTITWQSITPSAQLL